MEQPSIRNVIRDEERNITFVFMAYRKMSYPEMVMGVQMLWQQKRKPKKNTTVTVLTTHGSR